MSNRTRIIAALAVLPVVGAIALAHAVPVADHPSAETVSRATTAGDRRMACPGPVVPFEAETEAGAVDVDDQFASVPPSATATVDAVALAPWSGLANGSTTLAGTAQAPREQATLTASAGGEDVALAQTSSEHGATVARASVSAPTVVEAAAGPEGVPQVSTVQVTATGEGDWRGLAATTCTDPVRVAHLVGLTTEPGSSARLQLANPSGSPSVVTLEAYDDAGPVDLGGRLQVTVEAGATESLLLESLAPGAAALSLVVSSSGAPVAATVQQSRLSGFTPRGVDIVTPTAAPADSVLLPGVTVHERGLAALRLFTPIAAGGTAEVTVLGPDGPVTTVSAEIGGAATSRVDLGALAPGTYAIAVDADVPVAATAISSADGTAGERGEVPADIAYSIAPAALDAGTVVPFPSTNVANVRLTLVAAQATTATVLPLDAAGVPGDPVEVALAERTPAVLGRAALGGRNIAAAIVVPALPGTVSGGVTVAGSVADGQVISAYPADPVPSGLRSTELRITG